MSNKQLSDVIDSLNWRYATKLFDPAKKLSRETIDLLCQSLRLAPSSMGLQPWKFFVVEDAEIRKQLRVNAWNQPQITDSSHLIVLAAKSEMRESDIEHLIEHTALLRGVKTTDLAGYRQMLIGAFPSLQGDPGKSWMANQVYIALGVLLSACASARIDTCPMEGFDSKAFDNILKLTEKGYNSVALCAVGYRSAEDKYSNAQKVRFPITEVSEWI